MAEGGCLELWRWTRQPLAKAGFTIHPAFPGSPQPQKIKDRSLEDMTTVTEIRLAIVQAMERGEDTSKLEKQLKDAHSAEQAAKEIAELKAVADTHLAHQARAREIELKADNQRKSIETFLALRDEIVKPLAELVAKAKALPLAQSECYANFHDSFVFGAKVRQIPKGYLPEGFGCKRLEMADGKSPSYEKSKEAIQYLMWAWGILSNFAVGEMAISQAEAKEEL